MQERLQKIIARAGIASRRKAEELILQGLVTVNGQVVTRLGTKADPEKDAIKVKGKLIRIPRQKVYIMLNKPRGYITAASDPLGRPVVMDLLKKVKVRVFPVGRLDYNSEGLLLLTNDGDLAHKLMHPSREIPRRYYVKIKGVLDEKDMARLERGVKLEDGVTAPARVRPVRKTKANSWIEITIHEGKYREVRRMLERVGHRVIKLIRTGYGPLELGNLPEGQYRYLTPEEVKKLKEMVGEK